MPWMNFDLQDGKPPVGFNLKADDCDRFVQFMAECDALRAEVESLTHQLKAGESFHAVAVQQRDAAWREAESLRAEAERLRTTIKHVAAIAHCGGWVGLREDQALVYVRALTVSSMPGGSLNDATAVLQGAIDAARRREQDARGFDDKTSAE